MIGHNRSVQELYYLPPVLRIGYHPIQIDIIIRHGPPNQRYRLYVVLFTIRCDLE